MKLKTPGVYLRQKDLFPTFMESQETALPAFIGYTELYELNGVDLRNKPYLIRSLAEFEEIFGGAPGDRLLAVRLDASNRYAYAAHSGDTGSIEKWHLHRSIRLFYDNGGRECIIVTVGDYEDSPVLGDVSDPASSPGFLTGLKSLEKEPDPTLILFPDAVLLSTAKAAELQQAALRQCAALQSRFAIFDLIESEDFEEDVSDFRDNVGSDALNYGAVYTPFVQHSFSTIPDFENLRFVDSENGSLAIDLEDVSAREADAKLIATLKITIADVNAVENSMVGLSDTPRKAYEAVSEAVDAALNMASVSDVKDAFVDLFELTAQFMKYFPAWTVDGSPSQVSGRKLVNLIEQPFLSGLDDRFEDLLNLMLNSKVVTHLWDAVSPPDFSDFDDTTWLDGDIADYPTEDPDYGSDTLSVGAAVWPLFKEAFEPEGEDPLWLIVRKVADSAVELRKAAQEAAYSGHPILSKIVPAVQRNEAMMPPSGAIAGLYALADGAVGVWRAAANVAIRSIDGLSVFIDNETQEDLNVDSNNGKSVNAIRAFPGLGILVYGARTLMGNSPDWRYIPVRRLFIMLERQLREITANAVFEPNTLLTWVRLKALVNGILNDLYEKGALFGDSPSEAYYILIGLGETMTQNDILEGRMIMEIGLAAVRPAEFIVLEFNLLMLEQ